MAKRVRRTKAEMEVSKGLGDTIEKITTATGIKALVKFIAGEDCGCNERKEKLNMLFPYKQLSCLIEKEYNYLHEFLNRKHLNEIKPSEQHELLKIYNRVFNAKEEPTQCGSCWRDRINELRKLYETYETTI